MIDYRENNKWTVYIHISPSNKYYVGITSRKPYERWRGGSGYKKNKHFYRAIQKYGWNNFEHEIIAEHLTKDEACNMEKLLIASLNSNDYHYGYNITAGGESGLCGEKNYWYGKHHTEEAKIKMSKIHKGKHLSADHKKLISINSKKMWDNPEYKEKHSGKNASCYGRTGEKHPMYGKHGSECSNSKKVICLNSLEIFDSAVDGAKNKDCNNSKLSMCCRGERLSCGEENGIRLVWMYFDDYVLLSREEIDNKIKLANSEDKITKHSCKMVISLEDKFVFKSIKLASEYYGYKTVGRIGMACKDKNITACKKHWMFYEDYLEYNNLTDKEAKECLFFVA